MSEVNQSNGSTQSSESTSFTPPRHWVSLEELKPEYWASPEKQEERGQEFLHKPIETIEMIDRSPEGGMARREFLTIMGASMALASLSCARRPVNKIVPYVVRPESVLPGVPTYYASTCGECSSGCGVLIKTREGRPIKLEGNEAHPVNQGKLCSRGQASLLNLYDPDRLKSPVRVDRAQESSQPVEWAALDAEVVQAIAKAGNGVRFLSRTQAGPTTRKLVKDFLNSRGGTWTEYEALEPFSLIEAQAKSYGTAVIPEYRFDEADVVLSFGADFLGTWLSPVEHAAQWAKGRKLRGQKHKNAVMSKLFVVESGFSITGANADDRWAVRAGDEYKVAMAVAHALIVKQGKSGFAGQESVVGKLREFTPEKVAKDIGGVLTAKDIELIATELWNARGKSLVVAGGLSAETAQGVDLQVAVNLLNSVLENEGKTVVASRATPKNARALSELEGLVADMKAGRVKVLFIHQANPVYELPASLGFEEALKKVPFVVSFNDRLDETSRFASFVAPDHHYLENWGDSEPYAGVLSLQQPAIAPIYQTRAFQDSLLVWSGSTTKSWHDYLKNQWKQNVHPRFGGGVAFESFWEKSLQKGVVGSNAKVTGAGRRFNASSVSAASGFKPGNEGLTLALTAQVSMSDGRSANNGWLQELPDPITTVTWDNYLSVAPSTAEKYSLKTNDVVEVSSGSQKMEIPVWIQPGMHPGSVAAAIGYGRTHAGSVAKDSGTNVFPMAEWKSGLWVFSGQAVTMKKLGRKFELAATQEHHRTENRPIVNDITLAEFRKNEGAELHTDPHLRMPNPPSIWPAHKYPGYRWGMSIDISSCTGCGACITACQSENNVPIVGRARVRTSREMHWIRIDRYFSGSAENPQVVFQPMICQHCENAPCETVCPVLATVHNREGLNDMAYNRCVGTRYCQNNCPYKVRRFNYFDHWRDYQEPMNLAWNPDVTVRSRGVMEKCTFCTQRIESARQTAKTEGRDIRDGDIKTACQQTCPTDAIVFGNINDEKSEVSQWAREGRAYRVLEVLNAKPSVSYLTKVRNRKGSHEGSHEGSHA